MTNKFDFEAVTEEELSSVVGGGVGKNIVDGMKIGGSLAGAKGAILGGVLGWAFTPTKVS